jgi:hypothetical protein
MRDTFVDYMSSKGQVTGATGKSQILSSEYEFTDLTHGFQDVFETQESSQKEWEKVSVPWDTQQGYRSLDGIEKHIEGPYKNQRKMTNISEGHDFQMGRRSITSWLQPNEARSMAEIQSMVPNHEESLSFMRTNKEHASGFNAGTVSKNINFDLKSSISSTSMPPSAFEPRMLDIDNRYKTGFGIQSISSRDISQVPDFDKTQSLKKEDNGSKIERRRIYHIANERKRRKLLQEAFSDLSRVIGYQDRSLTRVALLEAAINTIRSYKERLNRAIQIGK